MPKHRQERSSLAENDVFSLETAFSPSLDSSTVSTNNIKESNTTKTPTKRRRQSPSPSSRKMKASRKPRETKGLVIASPGSEQKHASIPSKNEYSSVYSKPESPLAIVSSAQKIRPAAECMEMVSYDPQKDILDCSLICVNCRSSFGSMANILSVEGDVWRCNGQNMANLSIGNEAISEELGERVFYKLHCLKCKDLIGKALQAEIQSEQRIFRLFRTKMLTTKTVGVNTSSNTTGKNHVEHAPATDKEKRSLKHEINKIKQVCTVLYEKIEYIEEMIKTLSKNQAAFTEKK
eukprot:GHVN01018937.1.p1 GENE.GHVN01018937.1~~GHVN01018937.1.p1  ORF type:complete len:292 (-),score=23.34 GHVN01018937.1:27-902(-)